MLKAQRQPQEPQTVHPRAQNPTPTRTVQRQNRLARISMSAHSCRHRRRVEVVLA